VGAALGIAAVVAPVPRVSAQPALEAAGLVEEAQAALLALASDPQLPALSALLPRARAVFIAPQVFRAAVVVGASGGTGILLVRGEKRGAWHGPAFYTLGGASIGLQIGAAASSVVVLAMTERGAAAMLKPNLQVGADATLALGPVGAGVEGGTVNLSADLVAFARSRGLYGGVSLQGAVLGARAAWNHAYYGQALTPIDILVHGEGANLQAQTLLGVVQRLARGYPRREQTPGWDGSLSRSLPEGARPRDALEGTGRSSRAPGGP
jgi:lipid-binding SYLF domain-containing protein